VSKGKKTEDPFNNPMSGALKKLKDDLEIPVPAKPPPRPAPAPKQAASDDELFMAEMADVKPIERPPAPVIGSRRPVISRASTDDEDVMLHLDNLVSGSEMFDITATGEYVEGCVSDLDRRTLKKLRRGDFSREMEIDLHQMIAAEARQAVAAAIREAKLSGKRCMKIIHGRGLHSKDRTPVLKDSVVKWLSDGALSKNVLAFCSALPADGGIGAIYVLLRK
jgi:DNA-nicking Smr family endonuclease